MPYKLMGHLPRQRESNVGLDPKNQGAMDVQVVDEVDTEEEAEEIRRVGGYIKDDQWYVVVGWEKVD